MTTREEAKTLGLTTYDECGPCHVHGDNVKRRTINADCVQCHNEYQNRRYHKDPKPYHMHSRESTHRTYQATKVTANNTGKEWTADDIDALRSYEHLPAKAVAKRMGRTLYSIRWMRKKLKP